jgi:hypothetical protein
VFPPNNSFSVVQARQISSSGTTKHVSYASCGGSLQAKKLLKICLKRNEIAENLRADLIL